LLLKRYENTEWVIYNLIKIVLKLQLRRVDKTHYTKHLINLGSQIRQIRKAKGMSMEQLALETNIEYRQLGRIERGEGNSTIISLLRIAEILEVELKDFFV
jgi:ribosome-binding protein aMBF1 (putative translation factor)